jgi:beta-lactamase regulating signal transducer with metallopeptidase domain
MVATLARASVDGGLIVAVVWILSRLLHLSPATRTVLWWCAAAKFVLALFWTTPITIPVLPAATIARQEARQEVRPSAPVTATTTAAARRSPAAAPSPKPDAASTFVSSLREWSLVAAFVWVLGMTLAALVGWRRWRETELMRTASEPAPDALRSHVADLAERLQLRQAPEVRMSSRIETPLVTGLTRPVVLLPAARFPGLTESQQRMALCHELAHVKRADLWLGCVPALAERIFFFHPLAHLAAREYAVAREAACDAAVMRTLAASPQEYGRLLLTLGVAQPQASLTAAGAAWSFVNLKRRMVMLQDVSPQSPRSRAVAIAVVALAVAALVPMQLAARPDAQQTGPSAASSRRAAVAAAPRAQAAKPIAAPPADELIERETPRAAQKRDEPASFVFFPGGDRDVSFGSAQDTSRAKQLRKGDEPL